MKHINIGSQEEAGLNKYLDSRKDAEALRMRRFLNMPDLSRKDGSPLNELVKRFLALPDFKDFEDIQVPEIVPAVQSFDLFDFPADHPARSKSDTYWVDEANILRTHTTVSWYYYLTSDAGKQKIKNNESVGVLTYGKVYRKDEIDRHHMNVFHQVDGWYIIPKERGIIMLDDLKDILVKVVQAAFGPKVKYRFNEDAFPYTHPSLEMEIDKSGTAASAEGSGEPQWVEVLGCGVVKGSVLEKLGVDSKNYTGWAFGFGLERLAIISMELPDIRLLWSEDERVKKQLKLGQKYKEVSKYPQITRDFSFIVGEEFVANNYFDMIRDIGGDLVEEVALLDSYADPKKFGEGKKSYTFRVVCRSVDRTLTTEEVRPIQEKIYSETARQFNAQLR